MPWVRFDDQFPLHRKVRCLSDAAYRLHTEAIFWCARNLTDGFLSTQDVSDVATARRPHKFLSLLVDRGNWHRSDEQCGSPVCPANAEARSKWSMPTPHMSGWLIHDYWGYQPPKVKVLAERQAKALRQARWLAKKRSTPIDASQDASLDHSGDAAPPRPEKGGGGHAPEPRRRPRSTRGAAPPAQRTHWCGLCEETTRHIELNGSGIARCPRCHPLRTTP